MKKQHEITALTRNNLITAFWHLYTNNRIEKISIKQITDTAGYNRSTFYEYFTDVYALLEQLEENLLQDIKEYIVADLADNPLGDISASIATMYDSKGVYLSVLLGDSGDPLFREKFKQIMLPTLYKNFGLSQDDLRNHYIFEFAITAIISTITLWYKNGKVISSKELVKLIRSMLISGVYPEVTKSIKPIELP